jgi:ribose 1,5-bisphosphokinase PhnN
MFGAARTAYDDATVLTVTSASHFLISFLLRRSRENYSAIRAAAARRVV